MSLFGTKAQSTIKETIQNVADKIESSYFNTPSSSPVSDPTPLIKNDNGLIDVITLKGIKQVYNNDGKDVVLFDNFNFTIEDIPGEGQFIALLGKSGCGKSTILRYITGLQKPTEGEVLIYGKRKDNTLHIPMVFQEYSSFHWMSVIENVALPLLIEKVNKTEAFDRAEEFIKIVGLTGHENKWARYPLLSGGQLQRVAIARSLIANNKILVLDEPFSALDIKNRNELQNVLLDIFYNPNIDVTFVMVTHDIREAVYLANRLYIMKTNPADIYKQFNINFGPERRTREVKYRSDYIELTREIDDIMSQLH